jgi:hypothetical protein
LVSITVLGRDGQGASVGAVALLRGLGLVLAKSTALLFESSPSSRRVAQPGAIERRIAIPPGIPVGSAGEPGVGVVVPLKLPQETQSRPAQQIAPPLGLRLKSAAVASGAGPPGNVAA